uniref:Phosphoribosylaminoimidazole-succinocarboxamide synthase n=1 Tax=uncultured nuHF1 cluster bacterium HF0770_35I22 TaxID=723586 RepID=E7C7N6_9BACT|nr:phosphoribosylaminoimidazolesuccinocarboxamide (SAICAR) synthase [uncultured nuHF1 cluster bacterium HF0770_35I22]
MTTNITSNTENIVKNCLDEAHFDELPNYDRGKVRDSYNLPDGRRIMISTDRQSAFDVILASVPFKGQVLNQISKFWFDSTNHICPNHVIKFPDPNIVITKNLKMLPIEIIVRDYMTGSTETSIWPMYQKGERHMYGHAFDDGFVKNQKLKTTIITPTTKAIQGEHDAPITATEIIEKKLLSQETWDEVSKKALALFSEGRKISSQNGLILVDTKYEFGIDDTGVVTIADEIHTPDSSRFWVKASYKPRMLAKEEPESLDKEFLRLWISQKCDPYTDPIPAIPQKTLVEFSKKYVRLFEQVTGQKFLNPPENESIKKRIYKSLSAEFPEYFKK